MSFYRVTEWKKGLYRITSAEAVYMDLIVGEKKALLFDTGWGLGPLKETVRQITDKPLFIVNSHGHQDHVNGNLQFGETIYIHSGDLELCKTCGSVQMRTSILATAEQAKILPEGFDKERYLSDHMNTYAFAKEGDLFDLGGKTAEIIEIPGHTAGSIGLYLREEKVFLAADALGPVVLLINSLGSASLSEYRQSIEKAKRLDFDFMLTGHGDGKGIPKALLDTYENLTEHIAWEKAIPYEEEGKASSNVRMVCLDGQTLADRDKPGFTALLFTKDKL